MKTTIFSSLIGLILLSSCAGFLDKEPLEDLTETNFYKTESDAVRAINATYQPLAVDGEAGASTLGINRFGDRMGGDTQKSDASDPLSTFTILPNEPTVQHAWTNGYAGIFRANLALSKIPAISMADDMKNRLLAEAHFLRAIYYHYLILIFGDVPLITIPSTDTDDYLVIRTPVADIYRLIEEDLAFAEEYLPATYSGADIGRATQGAAKSYLTKVYLYQKKWDQAAEKAVEVITNATQYQYRLMDDYFYAFELENDNSPESIFEVQYASYLGGLGSTLNDNDAPRSSGFSSQGGYGNGAVSQAFVNHYEPGDPRIGFSVFRAGDVFQEKVYNPAFTPTGYSTKKYVVGIGPTIEPANSPKNVILMRYADLLLMGAEALNEIGNTTQAVGYINQVRQRTSVDMPPLAENIDQTELRNAIKRERLSELGLEGHHFFDLVRWGDAETYLHGIGRTNFKAGVNEHLPIPQAEMDLNKNLIQNPGY